MRCSGQCHCQSMVLLELWLYEYFTLLQHYTVISFRSLNHVKRQQCVTWWWNSTEDRMSYWLAVGTGSCLVACHGASALLPICRLSRQVNGDNVNFRPDWQLLFEWKDRTMRSKGSEERGVFLSGPVDLYILTSRPTSTLSCMQCTTDWRRHACTLIFHYDVNTPGRRRWFVSRVTENLVHRKPLSVCPSVCPSTRGW